MPLVVDVHVEGFDGDKSPTDTMSARAIEAATETAAAKAAVVLGPNLRHAFRIRAHLNY